MQVTPSQIHSEPTPDQLNAELVSLKDQYSEALKQGELGKANEIFLRIKELDKHLHSSVPKADQA
jgi:hypothetical protein